MPDDADPSDLVAVVRVLADSGIDEAVAVGFDAAALEEAGSAVERDVAGLRAHVVRLDAPHASRRVSPPYIC